MRTFDPFDLEKPVLRLGAGAEFTLGDITESRRKKLVNVGQQLESIDQDAEDADALFVQGVCDLVEAACEKPGAGAMIRDAWDSERIGVRALSGTVDFVMDWLAGNDLAGEA